MKKVVYLLAMFTFIATTSCSSDDSTSGNNDTENPNPGNPDNPGTPGEAGPVAQATMAPNVGGPNQPNQVFVDLSENIQTGVKRDSWDLGFSTGNDFNVIINGSVKMAVKQLNTTNIDEVQVEDLSVAVGYTTPAMGGFVDNPTGVLAGSALGEGTAIKAISATEADNKVYLVNLGFEVGTTTPNVGSVALDGEARGWKKVRITRSGSDYKVEYADLNATTHQTITISKDASYNFVYLNLKNGQRVSVQPKKATWDLSFTGFTNYYGQPGSQITYYFADYITTNMLGGTKVYMVQATAETLATDYEAFSISNVDESAFATSVSDQRVIGDSWRNGGGPSSGPSVKDDRFYVIKDAQNNIYKLRFLALTNDAGERGNPVFEYKLVK